MLCLTSTVNRPFLNQWKLGNGVRKDFIINIHESMSSDWVSNPEILTPPSDALPTVLHGRNSCRNKTYSCILVNEFISVCKSGSSKRKGYSSSIDMLAFTPYPSWKQHDDWISPNHNKSVREVYMRIFWANVRLLAANGSYEGCTKTTKTWGGRKRDY